MKALYHITGKFGHELKILWKQEIQVGVIRYGKNLYNNCMSLYWKNIEIVPGMMLDVDMLHHEAFNSRGAPVRIRWKILSFGSRTGDDAYIDYTSGKKYPMKQVVRKKRLQKKLEREELLQLPAGSDFLVVQEYHDGEAVYKRCYNLDMLQTVREMWVVEE